MGYVCDRCNQDPDLRKVVRANRASPTCDYCGRKSKKLIACELDDVIERIRFVVNQYYTQPEEFVYWNGREGGWQGHPVLDAWDLFDSLGFEVPNQDLMDEIVSAFADQQYANEDYWPGPLHERQLSSWERFKEIIKHERRYTFWSLSDDSRFEIAEPQPSEILRQISEATTSLELAKVLPAGAKLWRVRVHRESEPLSKASDFSSPPAEMAIYPNRMSPSGISMFYGAESFGTAVEETVDPKNMKGKQVTGAAFQNLVPLNILDLVSLPETFGFFSEWTHAMRESLHLLRGFTADISQPIQKDGREHTGYVPTQVFTEFVRYELRTPQNGPFHGIRYPSSKNGDACYVIFAEQDDCLPGADDRSRPQLLEFVEHSVRTVDFKSFEKARMAGHSQRRPMRLKPILKAHGDNLPNDASDIEEQQCQF